MWTQFWDMHSGGGLKQAPYHYLYIEAKDEEEATLIFYNRFGHNPNDTACPTCGSNYSINTEEDLAQLTGYHRGCRHMNGVYVEEAEPGRRWQGYQTLDEYFQRSDVLILRAEDVRPEEREGYLPESYYPEWDDDYDWYDSQYDDDPNPYNGDYSEE